jgi:hypothetical protein
MEAITRLVADSLARHGLDRPIDPRRLQWSRWFRCDSTHSLLVVPSKPGIFALAEEIMDLGIGDVCVGNDHFGRAAQACPEPGQRNCPTEQSSAAFATGSTDCLVGTQFLDGPALQRGATSQSPNAASAAEVTSKRMLAVVQFSEDDDMAFTLDRMFTRINPLRSRLASGRCFLRFVVINDQDQRRNICTALNQWLITSAEKATGIGSDFSSSLEMTTDQSVARTPLVPRAPSPASASSAGKLAQAAAPGQISLTPAHLDSGAGKSLHGPQPFPSGF